MEVDIIGANKLAEFIKNSGFTKFVIERIAPSKAVIYEFTHGNNNTEAVNEFEKFANLFNNSIAYKIILFDEIGKNKPKKEVSFVITNGTQNHLSGAQTFNKADIYREVYADIQRKQNEERILQRLDELDAKLNQTEEEEEEEESNAQPGAIPGLGNIQNILTLVELFKGLSGKHTQAPVINGINEEKIQNINKAIDILSKHNDNIDQDLLKLANIAENNPEMFKMLLSTLRNF